MAGRESKGKGGAGQGEGEKSRTNTYMYTCIPGIQSLRYTLVSINMHFHVLEHQSQPHM